jgi:hypothetical protein
VQHKILQIMHQSRLSIQHQGGGDEFTLSFLCLSRSGGEASICSICRSNVDLQEEQDLRRESEAGGSQRTERVESRDLWVEARARGLGAGTAEATGARPRRRRESPARSWRRPPACGRGRGRFWAETRRGSRRVEGVAERIRRVTGASHALDPGRSGSVRQNASD